MLNMLIYIFPTKYLSVILVQGKIIRNHIFCSAKNTANIVCLNILSRLPALWRVQVDFEQPLKVGCSVSSFHFCFSIVQSPLLVSCNKIVKIMFQKIHSLSAYMAKNTLAIFSQSISPAYFAMASSLSRRACCKMAASFPGFPLACQWQRAQNNVLKTCCVIVLKVIEQAHECNSSHNGGMCTSLAQNEACPA